MSQFQFKLARSVSSSLLMYILQAVTLFVIIGSFNAPFALFNAPATKPETGAEIDKWDPANLDDIPQQSSRRHHETEREGNVVRWKMKKRSALLYCESVDVQKCPFDPQEWDTDDDPLTLGTKHHETSETNMWTMSIDDHTRIYCSAWYVEECTPSWAALVYGKPGRWKRKLGLVTLYCDALGVDQCPLGSGGWEYDVGRRSHAVPILWCLTIDENTHLYCDALRRLDCQSLYRGMWELAKPAELSRRWRLKEEQTMFPKDLKGGCLEASEGGSMDNAENNTSDFTNQKMWAPVILGSTRPDSSKSNEKCWNAEFELLKMMRQNRMLKRWKRKLGPVTYCDAIKVDDCPLGEWSYNSDEIGEPPVSTVWYLKVDDTTTLYCTAKNETNCFLSYIGSWLMMRSKQRWQIKIGPTTVYCDALNLGCCPGRPESHWEETKGNVGEPPPDSVWILHLEYGIELYCNSVKRYHCDEFQHGNWRRRLWIKDETPIIYSCNAMSRKYCLGGAGEWKWSYLSLTAPSSRMKWYMRINKWTTVYCEADDTNDCKFFSSGARWKAYSAHQRAMPRKDSREQNSLENEEEFGSGGLQEAKDSSALTMQEATKCNSTSPLIYCDAVKVEDCPWGVQQWQENDEGTGQPPISAAWKLSLNNHTKLYCSSQDLENCYPKWDHFSQNEPITSELECQVFYLGSWIEITPKEQGNLGSRRVRRDVADGITMHRWRKVQWPVTFYCDASEVGDCPKDDSEWVEETNAVTGKPPQNAVWSELLNNNGTLYCTAKERENCLPSRSSSNDRLVQGGRDVGIQKRRRWRKKEENEIWLYCDALSVDDCPPEPDFWDPSREEVISEPPTQATVFLPIDETTVLYCSAKNKEDCNPFCCSDWQPTTHKRKKWIKKVGVIIIWCCAIKCCCTLDSPNSWTEVKEDVVVEPPVNTQWTLRIDEYTVVYCSEEQFKKCNTVKHGDWEPTNPNRNLQRWKCKLGITVYHCIAWRIEDCPSDPSSWDEDGGDISVPPGVSKWQIKEFHFQLFCSAASKSKCLGFLEGNWRKVYPVCHEKVLRWKQVHGVIKFYCDSPNEDRCLEPRKKICKTKRASCTWRKVDVVCRESPPDIFWFMKVTEFVLMYCSAPTKKSCRKVFPKGGQWKKGTWSDDKKGVAEFYCDATFNKFCPKEKGPWVWRPIDASRPPPGAKWRWKFEVGVNVYCNAKSLSKCREGNWEMIKNGKIRPPPKTDKSATRLVSRINWKLACKWKRWMKRSPGVILWCNAPRIDQCPTGLPPFDAVWVHKFYSKHVPRGAKWQLNMRGHALLYCKARSIKLCRRAQRGDWVKAQPPRCRPPPKKQPSQDRKVKKTESGVEKIVGGLNDIIKKDVPKVIKKIPGEIDKVRHKWKKKPPWG